MAAIVAKWLGEGKYIARGILADGQSDGSISPRRLT